MKQQEEGLIYNWLFHFNHYTAKWNGFHRDEYKEYFNGTSKNTVSDADHSKCVEKAFKKELSII